MSETEMDVTQGHFPCEILMNEFSLIETDFNNVFDSDQDPEEKRAVRQNYRSLTKKIEGTGSPQELFVKS